MAKERESGKSVLEAQNDPNDDLYHLIVIHSAAIFYMGDNRLEGDESDLLLFGEANQKQLLILNVLCGVIVSMRGYQTIINGFDFHWVPHTSGLVLN